MAGISGVGRVNPGDVGVDDADGVVGAVAAGPVWTAQPGPQNEAIQNVWVTELLFGGSRGGGKSDYLIADFLQDVPVYGKNWQGILFRRTLPELQEVVRRTHEIFPATGGRYYTQDKEWRWENGACLRMRYLERVADASRYQGHSYTWVGWDELTQWGDDTAYKMLKACLRWGGAEVPTKRIRCSANPGGPGHQWVKSYFIDPAPAGRVPIDDPVSKTVRMYIPSRITDNKILTDRDPGYIDRLRGVGSAELVRAWLDGDWNVVTGSFFPEFTTDKHVIKPFPIPDWWPKFRAFDWGSARPFCNVWMAVADGTMNNIPRGALVVYREWYGIKKKFDGTIDPNKGLKMDSDSVAQGIRDRENARGVSGTGQPLETILYSVADPSIFKEDGGPSIGDRFRRKGVIFRRADNARKSGATEFRNRLIGEDEIPMIYFFETCVHCIRTIPALESDPLDPEDVDTEGEDHAYDAVRYGVMSRPWAKSKPEVQQPRDIKNLTLNELWTLESRYGKQNGYKRIA